MRSRAARLRRLAGARRFAGRPAPGELRVLADSLPPGVSDRLRADVAETLLGVPAAQLAVRRRGELVWAACHGRFDRSGAAVAPEDRFVIASVTKPVVATLLLGLAERGALDLDAPVATWLPSLPHARRLTTRHLLGHRSGLKEYARDRAIARRLGGGEPDHRWRRQELVDAIARLGPEREPGGRFAYRNSNYLVAAEIAERASGEALATLLERTITRPLGLRGFAFAGGRLATPHASVARRPVDLLTMTGGRVPPTPSGPPGATAASRAARSSWPASPRRCSPASCSRPRRCGR